MFFVLYYEHLEIDTEAVWFNQSRIRTLSVSVGKGGESALKRGGTVAICILCVLTVVAGILVYRQWDNIMVLSSVGKHTTAEIEEMMAENTEARSAAVADIQVRELTEDEKRAVQSGELSEADVLERITGIPASPAPDTDAAPQTSPTPRADASTPPNGTTDESAEEDHTAELARLVGQIYVLEANFTGQLDNLLDSAIAEYRSLPPEMHNLSNQLSIGTRYLGVATALEKRCDEQMATLLSQIERTLIASGQGTELVGEIKSAYQKEKALTKDYYLSLYT